jgi:hypothetical protein
MVLTGTSNETDYTCSNLLSAEDNAYIYSGSMGETTLQTHKVCGGHKLHFTRNGTANRYVGYEITSGSKVATCTSTAATNTTASHKLKRHCDQWVGATYFTTAYHCSSNITCSS